MYVELELATKARRILACALFAMLAIVLCPGVAHAAKSVEGGLVAGSAPLSVQKEVDGSTDLSDGYFIKIKGAGFILSKLYVAEGETITPEVTVYFYSNGEDAEDEEGHSYLDPSNYTLTYKRYDYDRMEDVAVDPPFGPGLYTVFATAKAGSGYTGVCEKSFTIYSEYDLEGSTITFDEKYYDDDDWTCSYHIPAGTTALPTVSINGTVLSADKYSLEYRAEDYTYSSVFPTMPGEYVCFVEGKDPYFNSWNRGFRIVGNIGDAKVSGVSAQPYNPKGAKLPKLDVKYNGKKLVSGTDYTVSYANNKNAGNAQVTIAGIGNYSGKITKAYKVQKAANPVKLAKQSKTLKVKTLKKKAASFNIKKATGAKGSVKYSIAKVSKASFKNRFSIAKSTGKVTVKKNTPKGTYKLTVKASAAGDKNYAAGAASAVVTVKVA